MTNEKIYKGGEQETREAMTEAFASGDWSGWEMDFEANNEWLEADAYDVRFINDSRYRFHRKQRTMKINGVEVPMPVSLPVKGMVGDFPWIGVAFKSRADLIQFEAAMREVMEGGE